MNTCCASQSKVAAGVAVGGGFGRPFARSIEEVKEGEAGDRVVQAVRDVAEVGLLERAVEVVEQGGEGESFFWPELQEILAKGAVPAGLYELRFMYLNSHVFPFFLTALGEGKLFGLKQLSVRGRFLHSERAKELLKAVHLALNLTKLDLSGNPVADSWDVLGEESLPALTDLSLQGCYDEHCREKISSLIKAFPKMPKLRVLDLKDNHLREKADVIADGLKHLPNLEELNLQGTVLGDAGVSFIAKGLQNVPELRVLNLEGTFMGLEGVKALQANMKHVPKLKSLNLYGNDF